MTETRQGGEQRPREPLGGVRQAARHYLTRGWRVVELRARSKAPSKPGWQEMRLGERAVDATFLPQSNIGLLCGEASGGLVDVDCDAPEAVIAAAALLPATGMAHGRAGGPKAHYWYQIDGELPATAKYQWLEGPLLPPSPEGDALATEVAPAGLWPPRPPAWTPEIAQPREPAQAGFVAVRPEARFQPPATPHTTPHTTMLIELRANGCQTMVPPSTHPGGGVLRWQGPYGAERGEAPVPGEPARITAAALRAAVRRVAAAALLARHWPAQGSRDEAALALSGWLVRAGWAAHEVDTFVCVVARAAGDEEWRRRGGKAAHTRETLAAGKPVMGLNALAERLRGGAAHGATVVAQAHRWLGLPDHGRGDMGGDGRSRRADADSCERRPPATREAHTQNMSLSGADEPLCDSVARLDGILLSEVVATSVHWLWGGRIPLGKLTLLDGDPGLGKSLVTLDLIARVTTGRAMPDGTTGYDERSGIDGGAVLLSAEDDLAATIRPRLTAAGADVSRVMAIQTVHEAAGDERGERARAFTLPLDIPLLEEAIARVGARLVVIDPLMAYLDGRINSWRDQDVRATLAPLARLGEKTGAAILILRHLTKGGGANALYRGGGSSGIIGAARSGLVVAKNPDNPEQERILASSKSNLGPPMPSLRYRLAAPPPEDTTRDPTPRVEWLGASEHTAATLLATPADPSAAVERTVVEEACVFLQELLREGARPATDAQRAALAAGFSQATIKRVRAKVGVEARLVGFGPGAQWVWDWVRDDGGDVP